jgi:XapX domain-containing protein
MTTRPPLPPFTSESAVQKVRLAEDSWNSRDPVRVSQAYALDSRWRNRSEFVNGRQDIVAFLTRKWTEELDYRLIKELWAFTGNREDMLKMIVGIFLGLLIGAGCRWFDIPAPSPPKLAGALLIVAMTLGYMATDKLIVDKFSLKGRATTTEVCGGPAGDVVSSPRLPD